MPGYQVVDKDAAEKVLNILDVKGGEVIKSCRNDRTD